MTEQTVIVPSPPALRQLGLLDPHVTVEVVAPAGNRSATQGVPLRLTWSESVRWYNDGDPHSPVWDANPPTITVQSDKGVGFGSSSALETTAPAALDAPTPTWFGPVYAARPPSGRDEANYHLDISFPTVATYGRRALAND